MTALGGYDVNVSKPSRTITNVQFPIYLAKTRPNGMRTSLLSGLFEV